MNNTRWQLGKHLPELSQTPPPRHFSKPQLQPPNIYPGSVDHAVLNRRSMLLTALVLQSPLNITPPACASQQILQRVELPAGPEVPLPLREYFAHAVDNIAAQIGTGFTARLALYGVTHVLPSGAPGNPSRDYSKGSSERCGVFSPNSNRPYQLCPIPGGTPTDPTARDCCRHYAFAVPYNRIAFAAEDRMSTIVASPRIAGLPEKQWKAILAHELGHAIDFYLFGRRYRLRNNIPVGLTAELAAMLEAIDREETDPELRADALGELLVLLPRDQKLCYDPVLTLQTVVDSPSSAAVEVCSGDGSGVELMRHYTHAPLQGSIDRSL